MKAGCPFRSDRKPRGQGATRRPEILDAAKRLFTTIGFENTTIRRIAAEVGVSSTTLYIYFPDKDAILRAIAEATFENLLAMLRASQAGSGNLFERFRAGLRAYIAFGRSYPDEYRLTFLSKTVRHAVPGRPCRSPDGIEAADRSFDILQSSVASLMAAGVFQNGDPVLVAEAVWASLHGVTLLLLDHSDGLQSPPGALIECVIAMACSGNMAGASSQACVTIDN